MELIEDEQLEMMELAASSKGFSSIVHLDFDTLQHLESFRGEQFFFISVFNCTQLVSLGVQYLFGN